MRPAGSTAARIVGAALAMLIVAALAAWVLSPGPDPPDPVPVAAADYLAPAEIERAGDFRSGQRLLVVAGLLLELAALAALALGRPGSVRRRLERLDARPLLGAALAGAVVALLLTVVTLPVALIAHERAVEFGLSSQALGAWLWDLGRSALITAALTALGALLLIALVRRVGAAWWLPAAATIGVLAVAFVWIAPVLLAPVFNRFEELPEGRVRDQVVALGERAGVEIGEVYEVDASRRVTSLNAYVDGIGPTKRVVLYDNLLADAEPREVASVVAHELGHVAGDDLARGLLYIFIVAPGGMLFARELATPLARRGGGDPRAPSAVPAYLFAIALAAFLLGVPGNRLSRAVEARADAFALELTGDPRALIDLQVRLARANLTDPDPPGLYAEIFATHPSTSERIGAALAAARGAP